MSCADESVQPQAFTGSDRQIDVREDARQRQFLRDQSGWHCRARGQLHARLEADLQGLEPMPEHAVNYEVLVQLACVARLDDAAGA